MIEDGQMVYNKHYCLLYRTLPVPVEVQKIDAQTKAGLPGATFSLWRVGEDGSREMLADALTTDANGYLKGFESYESLTLDTLRNAAVSDAYDVEKNICVADGYMYLAPGHYVLHEEKAPHGYSTADDLEFKLTSASDYANENTLTLTPVSYTIEDEPKPEDPAGPKSLKSPRSQNHLSYQK